MGLVTKKSECKRRIDYLSQIEAELDNILFQKEIKSCRIITRKDIEKKAVKKSHPAESSAVSLTHVVINCPFEDIANRDRSFITRISKN